MSKLWILVVAAICCFTANAADRPNVLFIAIDDLRPELGCYGGPQVKSPNLDKLASQGVLFNRAYCQVAVCGASRASLMTGILPTAKRFRSYLTRADEDAPKAPTLAQVFKEAGYTTLSNGKIFHHRDDTESRSWSKKAWRPNTKRHDTQDPKTLAKLSKKGRGLIYEHADVPDNAYADGKIAEKTIADLQHLKNSGNPFFLACGFKKPHMPFYAPKKYWDLYEREKIQIADNRFRPKNAPGQLKGSSEFGSYHLGEFKVNSDEWHRMMRHGYLACVSYVDKLVGDVLTELEKQGLAENTIVVVWGDHGWHLGEHDFWGKHNTMHLSTRVPLIIKVPGKTGKSEALVETSDIFPTLCTLADLPIPATVQGRSLLALFDDPTKAIREAAYCRYGSGDAAITERYSYTRYRNREEMLYDHQKDPQENMNVVGNPEYKETLEQMRSLLAKRMKQAQGAVLDPLNLRKIQ